MDLTGSVFKWFSSFSSVALLSRPWPFADIYIPHVSFVIIFFSTSDRAIDWACHIGPLYRKCMQIKCPYLLLNKVVSCTRYDKCFIGNIVLKACVNFAELNHRGSDTRQYTMCLFPPNILFMCDADTEKKFLHFTLYFVCKF